MRGQIEELFSCRVRLAAMIKSRSEKVSPSADIQFTANREGVSILRQYFLITTETKNP